MVNQEVHDELIKKFQATFGAKPKIVAYAPGRIEVLGNHTDYNEGYVFSAAINLGTFFAVSPTKGTDCHLVAGDLMKQVDFDISDVKPMKTDTWQNYVIGTFNWIFDGEPAKAKHGFNAMFLGNIPLGSGLSSSAALEMCTGLALAKMYGLKLSPTDMAKAGQKAEHTFAGCPCGLLDQISSLAGKENMLVKTDFRSLKYENVSMGKDVCFLMVASGAKHALVDGAYASRRAACEEAAKFFATVLRHPVTHLRDVSAAEWILYRGGLSETVAKRAIHPIGEDERVLQGAKLLESGDLKGFGALMFDSHESSRNWFENSCEELDAIVDIAKALPGVLGARLSGGGFGGSCVILTRPDDAARVSEALAKAFETRYGRPCKVSLIQPSAGAHVLGAKK